METVVALSLWFFALTHVDTLIVLIAFLADGRYRIREVLLGHYAGFAVGLVAALVMAAVVAQTLHVYSYLLGIVPLALGLWGFYRRRKGSAVKQGAATASTRRPTGADTSQPADGRSVRRASSSTWLGRVGIVTVAGVGLSGENIAVFVPFFLTLSNAELLAVTGLYLLAAGLLFLVALVGVRRAPLSAVPDWVERLAVPTVLVAVGLYVFVTGWLAA